MNILKDCPILFLLKRNGHEYKGLSFMAWFVLSVEKIKAWVRARFNTPLGVTFAIIICTQVLFVYATFQR